MLGSTWGPLRHSRGCPSRPTASLRAPLSVLTAWAGEDASHPPVSTRAGSVLCILDAALLFRITWGCQMVHWLLEHLKLRPFGYSVMSPTKRMFIIVCLFGMR